MTKTKRLTELIIYETMRVRIEIFYDKLISTIEAKDTAIRLIKNENTKVKRRR